MNRNEATRFVAQINAEQSGQFQRVYDTLHTGVSDSTNSNVETIIKQQGGCRKVLTDFVNSEPETDFKKSIQMDWAFKPITYYDEADSDHEIGRYRFLDDTGAPLGQSPQKETSQ